VEDDESVAAIFRVLLFAAVLRAVFVLSIVLRVIGAVLGIILSVVLRIFTHLNSPPLWKYYALHNAILYDKKQPQKMQKIFQIRLDK
jgi:hypothetical protein